MKKFTLLFAIIAIVGVLPSCADIENNPAVLPQSLITRGVDTVNRFKRSSELKDFSRYISEARAIVILPTVVKAGFIGAAEAGHGMLLVRYGDGQWSYPAFYTLAAGSFGLQIGIQDVETVLIIRSENALASILEHQGKIGADAGLTVGVFGGGVEASTTTNLNADILAFAHSKIGLFGGISLEGAVLARRNDLNEAFYGKGATPRAIVLQRAFKNPRADVLRAALARK